MKIFKVSTIEELAEVSMHILSYIKEFPVVCFNGEMGAGKTTLIKQICEDVGVLDSMSSPTFSIVNEYRNHEGGVIYHFDFYRLQSEREAVDIGVDEYLYSGDICLIEWANQLPGLIPPQHLEINIKLVGEMEREISIELHD